MRLDNTLNPRQHANLRSSTLLIFPLDIFSDTEETMKDPPKMHVSQQAYEQHLAALKIWTSIIFWCMFLSLCEDEPLKADVGESMCTHSETSKSKNLTAYTAFWYYNNQWNT